MTNKWLKLFPDATRNKADFLLDGEEAFEDIIHTMETAKAQGHYIYILGWMLDVDFQLVKYDKDKTLFKLLSKAAEQGVEIRILIWDNPLPSYAKLLADAIPRLNKLPNTKAFIDEHTFFPEHSKRAIQQIAPNVIQLINKIGDMLGDFRPEAQVEAMRFEVGESSLSLLLYRLLFLLNSQTVGAHHEKVVIVKGKDGLTAFCGGIDFNKNRVLSEVNKKEYRFPYLHDSTCRLEGPAAYEILQRFKRRWRNHPVAKQESLLGSGESKPKEADSLFPYAKVVGTYNSLDHSEKDRSLHDAYLAIIENAKTYIYIEDQYLVNLDVARALNKKIKDPYFKKVIFAIQDSIETSDIFIPNRKRGEFSATVRSDTSDAQKDKVLFLVIDKSRWKKDRYHPAMHAKTLIADDEIAIIGSANVNQRSFTCDSETSVIVFNDTVKVDENFARGLRMFSWLDFLRMPVQPQSVESWLYFAYLIDKYPDQGYSHLVKYTRDSQDDLDERIIDLKKSSSVVGVAVVSGLLGEDLLATQAALHPDTIPRIFDTLWEHFIDPKAD